MDSNLSKMKFDTAGSFVWLESTTVDSIVANQVKAGLTVVSDGHRGRRGWSTDFFTGFDGLERVYVDAGRIYQVVPSMTSLLKLTGKIRYTACHSVVDEFKELKRACDSYHVAPRVNLPAPAVMLSRVLAETSWRTAYSNISELKADIVSAYNAIVADLYGMGARFIMFEDSSWVELMDDRGIKELLLGGVDVVSYIDCLVDCDNQVLGAVPSGVTTALYVSRETYDMALRPTGDYSLIAPKLFAAADVDMLYLDLNTDSDNDFSILKHVGRDKRVMLGIMSPVDTLTDSASFVRYNIEKAAEFFPMDNIGVSFHCGVLECRSMLPTESAQWTVLGRAVSTVREIFETECVELAHS